ncbi:hypothetical protein PENTCL1PPCAC_1655, partial [Pristionchus entomophagus]
QMVFFDEEDIRRELLDMGYSPDRKFVEDLRKSIAMADERRVTDENYESTHPFLGLDVESRRPPMREGERGGGWEVAQSPLVIKSKAGRNPLRWNPQIPDAIDTITFVDTELDGLMEKAYASVEKTYRLVDEAEDMKVMLEEMDLKEMIERADREAMEERRRANREDSTPSTMSNGDEKEEETGRKSTIYEEMKEREKKIREKRIEKDGQRSSFLYSR